MTLRHAPTLLIMLINSCIFGCGNQANSLPGTGSEQGAIDRQMREDIELDRLRQLVRELMDEQQQRPQPADADLGNAIAEQLAHRAALDNARKMTTGITQNKLVAETIIADSIEAQQIELVDKQGITRMKIVGDHEHNAMGPAVILQSKEGQTLAHLSETSAGVGLAISDPDENPRVTILVNDQGSSIAMLDKTGKPRVNLICVEGGLIIFNDESGEQVVIDGDQMVKSKKE